MKIRSFYLDNVRSFREPTEVVFDSSLNLLTGPNGGGKSNLLDALTIVLRRFFLVGYHLSHETDERGPYKNLSIIEPFGDIARQFPRFSGEQRGQEIRISFEIEAVDIATLNTMVAHRSAILQALRTFRSAEHHHLAAPTAEDLARLQPGTIVTYRIVDNNLLDVTNTTKTVSDLFYHYLRKTELVALLGREGLLDFRLPPTLLYLPPSRGGGQASIFVANLSGTPSSQQLTSYFATTSRTPASLIPLATMYLAEKRRYLEASAKRDGFEELWAQDAQVAAVTKHLRKLGYEWRLDLVNRLNNSYRIELLKDGVEFDISRASSGEQEILNYIFGIFALNLTNGILLIDEAELHLHPRWQLLLLELLQEIARDTSNQLVVSTHSGTFITSDSLRHLARVYKEASASRVIRVAPDLLPDLQQLLHIVTTHNNERMFFADTVVLVEGIKDRLLFARLIQLYKAALADTSVVEVLEVHGKAQFAEYRRVLDAIRVRTFEIGDLDYVRELAPTAAARFLETDWRGIDRKVLRDKKSHDRQTLAQSIAVAIEQADSQSLKGIWEHIRGRHTRLRDNLDAEDTNVLRDVLLNLRASGRFVLQRGELEDYLPAESRSIRKLIDFIGDPAFTAWLCEQWDAIEVTELREIVCSVLGVDAESETELRHTLCA